MKIVHVSFARITGYSDPELWLKRINFFVHLLEEMAKDAEVKSVHCINYSGVFRRNEVDYHFVKLSDFQTWIPIGLCAYVARMNPDVVIVHGLFFPWQVLLLRSQLERSVPILVQHHSEKPFRSLRRVMQKMADRFISAYFFPSQEQAQPWIEQGQISGIEKVYEIMEVPSVFYPIERSTAKASTGVVGSLIYLWVGRFDENKDPITLLKAFIGFAKSNATVSLYIIYQQNELIKDVKKLLAAAPEVSNQIFLVGKIAHDDLLPWFNSAEFFISTSHYEGMGVAVAEAMSCGCIPILSDIPSLRAMTDNGDCGLLFSPGDADNLLLKLQMSQNLDVGSEREKVLRRYGCTMSAEAISQRMLSVCKKIFIK